jgi:hydroxypyruvate isomerase
MTLTLTPCLDAMLWNTGQAAALEHLARWDLRTFEFWDWRTRDVGQLADLCGRLELTPVAFSGNTFEEPLVDPAGHRKALDHLAESISVASRLNVRTLVVHVGYAQRTLSRELQWMAAVRGLREAGDLAAEAGLTLVAEPLNSLVDHPGYFLDSLPQACALLREVDHSSVRLLLDVYHMAVMHHDLLDRLADALPLVAHVHVADVPGRGEPGSGSLAWRQIVPALRRGYRGPIGLEWWPMLPLDDALERCRKELEA